MKHITAYHGNALHILSWYFCENFTVTLGTCAWGNKTGLKFVILSPLHKVHVGRPRRMFVYSSIVCFLSNISSLSMYVRLHVCVPTHTHTNTKLMTPVSLLSFSCKSTFHIFSLQEHFQSALHMAFQ